MADKVKRWACRQGEGVGAPYMLYWSSKPLPYDGPSKWKWKVRNGKSSGARGIDAYAFEMLFPEQFHLKPGGGPVEIRFADEA